MASMVFAASGMQECTKPEALARTSTLRGCLGLAGALSGNAAIIFSTSSGLGVWFWGPGAQPTPAGGGAGCGKAALTAAASWSCVSEPVLAESPSDSHLAKAAFSSSRVTNPSLFASAAVKTPAAAPPRPPPRPPGAVACCASSDTIAPTHKAAAHTPISNVAFESLNGMVPPMWTEHLINVCAGLVYPANRRQTGLTANFRQTAPEIHVSLVSLRRRSAYNQGMVKRAVLLSIAVCFGLHAEIHP